jgi:ADP-dependent glucokinase
LKIRDQMQKTTMDTRIHFEMASYTDEHLLKDLTEHIIPYADSLGMNEQELPNVFAILSQDSISIVSDAYPRVATTLDTMRNVFK